MGFVFVPQRQGVTLSTTSGVLVYQWLPANYKSLTWTREGSKASKCDLVVPNVPGLTVFPWLHRISVWDMDTGKELWRGPVVHRSRGKDFLSLSARDNGIYLQKTRVPMTKRWDGQYPATIAAELWSAMLDQQGIDAIPQIMDDPLGAPFDYSTTADEKLLSVTMDDLVKLGGRWTLNGPTPVLGPMPLKPVAALAEHHFLEHDLELVMDGSQTCNDLVLRGADSIGQQRQAMPGGLVLQGIATVNDMFGVSNVDRAIGQYLRYHSKMQEVLSGSNVTLRLDAPIRLSQVIPSARVTINLYDRTTLMAIDTLTVTADDSGVSGSITVEAVNDDPPELDSKADQGALA